MAKSVSVDSQYAVGSVRGSIERALRAAGKDPERLDAAELALMEDFHASGRLATAALIELANITAGERVLDAGAGIGGASRVLALQVGCRVSALDLTEDFCEVARWLNNAVGLGETIEVRQGDVLDMPFETASFDVVLSQHVQMNIADKERLYREARRVLRPGGRLAIWDVTAGPEQPLDFPLPWADMPELSHLVTPEQLLARITAAGFAVAAWNDLTKQSAEFMRSFLAGPQPSLGLHVFVPEFDQKLANLQAGLEQGRARLIQAVMVAG